MKKLLFYLVLGVQCVTSVLSGNDEKLLVTGLMQFPSSIIKPPSLKVLYQGYKYPVEVMSEVQRKCQKGHFELYIDSNCKELYILIAENLQRPDENNFEHLKTSPNFSYRLYKLVRYEVAPETKEDSLKISWSIHQVEHAQQETVLPNNTIILFMPPAMIAKLEEDPWFAEQHVARLPRIIFHETVAEKELNEAANKMTLALLDFELFHAELPKRFMITESRIVAMPYLQRTLHI